jgi:hypothetical protein
MVASNELMRQGCMRRQSEGLLPRVWQLCKPLPKCHTPRGFSQTPSELIVAKGVIPAQRKIRQYHRKVYTALEALGTPSNWREPIRPSTNICVISQMRFL